MANVKKKISYTDIAIGSIGLLLELLSDGVKAQYPNIRESLISDIEFYLSILGIMLVLVGFNGTAKRAWRLIRKGLGDGYRLMEFASFGSAASAFFIAGNEYFENGLKRKVPKYFPLLNLGLSLFILLTAICDHALEEVKAEENFPRV